MALTYPIHVLVVWGGHLGSPALETWVNTLHLNISISGGSDQQELSPAQQDQLCIDLATPLQAFHGGTQISADAYMDYVKANTIGTDGKYIYSTTSRYDLPTPKAGTAATRVAWQLAWAVTLTTTASRGRARRGRFYPPASPAAVPTNGTPYIVSSAGTTFIGTAKTLINAINSLSISSGSLLPKVSLVSPGNSASGTAPLIKAVTGLQLDLVPDTQRRRLKNVPRNAVSATIP